MMRLSIIIPCYNMERYLPQCLDSILDQGLDPEEYEIIIINDGSLDGTLQTARTYAARCPQVVVLDKKNAGVGAARNSGLDLAKGHYIYFLDPDDYLTTASLIPTLTLAESLQVEILTFRSVPVSPDKYDRLPKTEIETVSEISDGITYIANRKYPNEIWWYLIKAEFIRKKQIRFIEGKWMEDAILTAQLFCGASTMAYTDRDVHRYRLLPGSAMRNKTPEHYNKVIFDNANAAFVFDELIRSLSQSHPMVGPCTKRLKTRQQSFVFFLLVRLMKSDLPVAKIPELLSGFETIDAYPLKKFLGKDYNGFSYSIMVYIFNHKPLIKPFVTVFRTFYSFVR